MSSLANLHLHSKTQINFTGDNLSFDAGLLLIHNPATQLFLRGDSGFATPEFYKQAESNGCSYAIRLKDNRLLRENESLPCRYNSTETIKNWLEALRLSGNEANLCFLVVIAKSDTQM